MAMAPGTKLGPYEITAPLGAGGMGEVYRARDTRLDRDVAIKVSVERFTDRFAQEARSIAALNHTNTCHLYDVGPNYLVMELVEGETLQGPLTFEQALPVIHQLIDGIEAAHDRNIAHRDLKPANIKITPDGVVKILDFGLAKAAAPEPEGSPEVSPTQTIGTTKAGTILGTAAYMSPEQARGKTADKRSDIWSFGAVVYELLTGKKTFEGESVVETLGAVINKEPDFAAVPERARPLLEWCLEKDRKKRLQAIGDARRLVNQPAAAQPSATRSRPWIHWALAAAAIVALAAGWFAAGYFRKPPPRRVATFTIDAPDGTFFGENALSPDGRQIALVALTASSTQLLIRSLDNLSFRPIAGTEQMSTGSLVWSPDSRKLAFVQQGQIKILDVSSGAVRSISRAERPSLSDWGENGMILFSAGAVNEQEQVFQVPATGGPAKPLLPVDARRNEVAQGDAYFLPGGKQVIYYSAAQTEPGVYVASLSGAPRKFVTNSGVGAEQFFRDPDTGKSYLFFCEVECEVQQFDTGALRLIGDPYPVGQQNRVRYGSFSASGLTFVPRDQNRIKLAWYSREGKEMGVEAAPASLYSHELSPDNKQLGLEVTTEPRGFGDIWTQDLVRGSRQRLTSDPGWEYTQRFWPDGSRIAYMSSHDNPLRWNLVIKPTNGAGSEDLVLESPVMLFLDDISPDAAFLLYTRWVTPFSLWLLPMADRKPVLFHSSSGHSQQGRFSPDGHWIAYASTDSGAPEIQVLDFEAATAQHTKGELTVVSTGGGSFPRWSRDGKELFYIASDNSLMSVPVKTAGRFTAGKPEKLFRLPTLGYFYRIPYAVANDSRRFLVAAPERSEASNRLVVVTNWLETLTK
jgi:eukaryotic-like serine/threonine-protein kinase